MVKLKEGRKRECLGTWKLEGRRDEVIKAVKKVFHSTKHAGRSCACALPFYGLFLVLMAIGS